MRKTFCVASSLILTLVPAEFARSETAGRALPRLIFTVRVSDMVHLSQAQLSAAEAEAARILSKAGVDTVWLDCTETATGGQGDARCDEPVGDTDLVMNLVPRSITGRVASNDMEFGFAPLGTDNPSGTFGKIFYVFYHRAEDLSKRSRFSATQILGFVTAHEIGHLLLGPGSHSREGIMRAEWDKKTLQLAHMGGLVFTREQAEFIQSQALSKIGKPQASQVVARLDSER